MDSLKTITTVTYSEALTALELKPGKWVAARRLRRTENGTVIFEGIDRHGDRHRGTRSQVLKACEPYSRRADATKRAATSAD